MSLCVRNYHWEEIIYSMVCVAHVKLPVRTTPHSAASVLNHPLV